MAGERKIAFILAGDASRGAYQAGCLKRLDEDGIRPDLLIGYQRALAGESHTEVLPILNEMHQLSFIPVYDTHGAVERVLGVGVDVTERIRAEQQLTEMAKYQQQMSEYLTLLLESTGDGVYSVDSKGRCTFINRAGASMLGYTPAEVVGSRLEKLNSGCMRAS